MDLLRSTNSEGTYRSACIKSEILALVHLFKLRTESWNAKSSLTFGKSFGGGVTAPARCPSADDPPEELLDFVPKYESRRDGSSSLMEPSQGTSIWGSIRRVSSEYSSVEGITFLSFCCCWDRLPSRAAIKISKWYVYVTIFFFFLSLLNWIIFICARNQNIPIRACKAFRYPRLGPRGWRDVTAWQTTPEVWHDPHCGSCRSQRSFRRLHSSQAIPGFCRICAAGGVSTASTCWDIVDR
jgi:hypothetical protein